MPGKKMDFDVVREMALALPGVEESTLHGAPSLKVRGKLLTCPAIHRSAEPNTLAVRIDFDRRAELIAAEPGVYYVTDHYVNYPTVLVRLSHIDRNTLRELLGMAWRFVSSKTRAAKPQRPAARSSARKPTKATAPALLAGGNPQIAKADGDAPVQAYIAAMPGWKRDRGQRLDALIVQIVPDVRKAVKWNSPFYGLEGQGWFLSFHCCTKYIKVAFFRGAALRPVPPGKSKQKEVRYLDIHQDDQFDEAQMATWVKQAAALPGFLI
jgi:hypothetical protein